MHHSYWYAYGSCIYPDDEPQISAEEPVTGKHITSGVAISPSNAPRQTEPLPLSLYRNKGTTPDEHVEKDEIFLVG